MREKPVVIECLFKILFMCTRPPYAFQVKESTPLPLGTTLYGALIYSLLHNKKLSLDAPDNGESISIYSYANRIYKDILNNVSITCRPHVEMSIARTDLVVRQARYDRKKDPIREVLGDYKRAGNPQGFDAMIKSMITINDLILSIAAPRKIKVLTEEITIEELVKYIQSITRIGDSESLCCCLKCNLIKEPEFIEAGKNDVVDSVNTVTPIRADDAEFLRVKGGNAVIVVYNDVRRGLLYTKKPNYMLYTLPLVSYSVKRKGKIITLYGSSSYDLEVATDNICYLRYKSPIDGANVVHVYTPSYIKFEEKAIAVRKRRSKTRKLKR